MLMVMMLLNLISWLYGILTEFDGFTFSSPQQERPLTHHLLSLLNRNLSTIGAFTDQVWLPSCIVIAHLEWLQFELRGVERRSRLT